MQALHQRIADLEARNAELLRERSPSATPSQPMTTSTQHRATTDIPIVEDITIKPPAEFTGTDASMVNPFLAQVQMYTDLQPTRYRVDTQKVLLAASCLRDSASK